MLKFNKIPRAVIVLGLISFFTDFASEMLYPVTPIFLTSLLGASMTVVGIIEGIAEVTAGLLKGYFGSLSDRIGKRSIFIVIGYGLSGIIKSLPGFIASLPVVISSRIIDRIGKGIRTAPRDALLASHANGNTGAVFGFHRGMDTLGAVAGPVIAIVFLSFFPGKYQWVYLLALIPSVFAIGFTFIVKDRAGKETSTKKTDYALFWKTARHEYKLLLLFFTIFSFVNSSDVFLILRSKQVTHSDTTAIIGYVFYNLIYALASYPVGLLADKFGKKNIFIIGMMIFSVVYFGFAVNNDSYLIWILFTLYGIYAASTEGVTKAWVSDLVADEFRGTAIGLLTMLAGLAVMFGTLITGVLWDAFGPIIPFLISSIVSFLIVFLLILGKNVITVGK
jgi:MFS family permease